MKKLQNGFQLKGSYVIKVYDSITGELISETKHENRIISSAAGYGRNLVMRQLTGDTTYPIEIDSASIGTGTSTPVDADTNLQTPVLTNIPVANVVLSNDSAVFTFFITTTQLANGTYNEFGIFCNGRLFARSIVSPAFTKGTNQNAVVDYTITLSST